MFLYKKLKPECKKEYYFLHGEHDVLYIGSDFNLFEGFTEEDAREAAIYGINIDEDYDHFSIYASM